jgi:CHAT domain-containing protein/Tfp pilus assembly protein PilF
MEIHEKLVPDGVDAARSLINWGLIAKYRGDYINAEDRYRKALAIAEKLAPGSPLLAAVLNNLGNVASERGDLDTAEDFFQRALAITEKTSPGTLDVARRLNNLGVVAFRRGDFQAAENHYRRALEIGEKLSPDNPAIADFLINLGGLAYRRGDLASAETFEKRALAIGEKLDEPYGAALETLGDVARDRNDLASAEGYYRQALGIAEIASPESEDLAQALHRMGDLSRRKGDIKVAIDYFERTVHQLELQQEKLGGADDVRSAFAGSNTDYYSDLAEQYAATGRYDDAFHVLERSRARGLLQMIAERNIIFTDLPANLNQERKVADKEYDRTLDQVADLNPAKDAEKITKLLGQLRELRDRREGIYEQIRKASPRLAALQYPQPLTLEGAQHNLDPGTVLLSYMVTKDKLFLFVTKASAQTKAALSVFPLAVGEEELRRKIETFRSGIQHPEDSREAWVRTGRELYDLLVKPAADWIAQSDRVLISPDGPLHALPFGALVVQSAADGSSPKYWIQTKPLHVVTSATLYAELKKDRHDGPVSLVAFGDPSYPALSQKQSDQVADAQTRSLLTRGYSFEPLPSSRSEVETIASLFPGHATVYVGKEATEEKAKATGKDVRYVHFAAHGILDERFPLNSALVLSMPEKGTEGRDNGLLQAWEIFEHVRIDADLVVLSACESALGKEMGGEGLLGLTRAFQYAGARSIVASLWSVADESTSELMKRFYGYLKNGKSKDEALRAAQIDLIEAGDLPSEMAHPFHWAAFELIGDWK